jgi:hypothetical protein
MCRFKSKVVIAVLPSQPQKLSINWSQVHEDSIILLCTELEVNNFPILIIQYSGIASKEVLQLIDFFSNRYKTFYLCFIFWYANTVRSLYVNKKTLDFDTYQERKNSNYQCTIF